MEAKVIIDSDYLDQLYDMMDSAELHNIVFGDMSKPVEDMTYVNPY